MIGRFGAFAVASLAAAWSGCGGSGAGEEDAETETHADEGLVADEAGGGEDSPPPDAPVDEAGAEDAPGEEPTAEDTGVDEPGGEDAPLDEAGAEPLDGLGAEDAPLDEIGAEDGDEGGGLPAGCVEGTFQAFWGDLHAHTSNSDGEGTPEEAFAHARDSGRLDIMVVTDHLEQLYLPTDRWGSCRTAADAANVDGSYVAACGFEYGSGFDALFRSTGHNNVFFEDDLFPAIQLDFHDFYADVAGCADCIAQYNHPGDGPEEHWNHWEYAADVDAQMNLYELNADPAWDWYFDCLDAGWHVSPMNNQDNHSANWGTANERRSAFWMSGLTRDALHAAMRERRSFATYDANAAIRLTGYGTCWMGSILTGVATSVPLAVDVDDPDAADGFTALELYGPGGALLSSEDCGGATTCSLSFAVPAPTGPQYVLARAEQADGGWAVSAPLWLEP
jgi:hypothetical protein